MHQKIFRTAAILGLIAVALGAFGAHGLRDKISVQDLENWKTAANYQFVHALVLLVISGTSVNQKIKINNAALLFILGIICFSGSLYLLATRAITGISTAVLGPVTPIGGLLLILGWLFLIIAPVKKTDA
ncbi:DUF423 domain-containing protein [Pedobacter sp. HMF7647]|uniref:DUF423 domain-containing protein n=1 Tax=Hufsiella arboris TaxID=2695275 RepID=A0A7K1YCB7_9SPHI|nr:DUF423 domain-containing protein [Hufsiella arboris]MXV52232.1 DUF423 domain-containing protein [Hufsiella arboris]